MKFFQIHGFGSAPDTETNPIVVAWNAREAGMIFCRRRGLPYVVLHPELQPGDSECFAHPDSIPMKWAAKGTDQYQQQIDGLDTFFVDAVCLHKPICVECAEYERSGLPLEMADARIIQDALNKLVQPAKKD